MYVNGNAELNNDFINILEPYDTIIFESIHFNQSLDKLPYHIKYIDLSSSTKFNKPLENLPPNLIGIALPSDPYGMFAYSIHIIHTNYKQKLTEMTMNMLSYLPHGIKYISIK
jgi:hypothetical protein